MRAPPRDVAPGGPIETLTRINDEVAEFLPSPAKAPPSGLGFTK